MVQKTLVFKPKATFTTQAYFVDASGSRIDQTTSPNIRLKIIHAEVASADRAPGNNQSEITASSTPAATTTDTSPYTTCPPNALADSYRVTVTCNIGQDCLSASMTRNADSCNAFEVFHIGARCTCSGSSGEIRTGTVTACNAISCGSAASTADDSDSDGDPDSADCAPNNPQVHHGQTNWFQNSANGSFDYNCDGVATKQFSALTTLPSTSGTVYSSGPGDWCNSAMPGGTAGFVNTIPECGQSGQFRYCTKFSEADCRGTSQASDGTACDTQIGPPINGPARSWAIVDGGLGGQIAGSVPQQCH